MAQRGKTIITTLLEVMAAKPGKVLTSDQITKAARLENAEHVRNSLTAYARLHPNGPVERISSGLFRWNEDASPVSAQPAHVNGPSIEGLKADLVAADGWVAPAVDDLDVPVMTIKRGGVKFPPPLAPGVSMSDAEVVHVDGRLVEGEGVANDVYFTWRGKMWKAYQI